MQVSSHLEEVLKEREALRLNAYQDSAGVWTIGWGATTYETGSKVQKGAVITIERANQLLNYHLGVAAAAVNSLVSANINQSQFDALVSFTYNVGSSAFQSSTLRGKVNLNPSDSTIPAEFRKWVYVTKNGVKIVSAGLVNRREEEIQIYSSGAENVKKKFGRGYLQRSV